MPAIENSKPKKRKLNKTASASMWYIGSNILAKGIAFLFTPIFTRLLTPEEYGIYSLYVSLMGIFTVLTTFQMSGNVIYRGFARFGKERRAELLSSALGAQGLISGLSLIVFALLGERVSRITSLGIGATLILILQIFLTGTQGFYIAGCRYDGNFRTAAFINAAVGVLTPILSLILIRVGFRGYARILSLLFVSVAVTIPIAIKIIREGKRLVWREGWSFIFKMTLPMLPHYILSSVIAQSDKIIIAKTLGEGELGKYGAAYSIGFVISQLSAAFITALSPWIIRKMKALKYSDVSDAISSSAKVIGYLTLLFLLILPELFAFAAAPEYREALPVSYIVAVSVVFSFLSSVFSICILHYEKPMLITKNSLTAAAITVPLSYFLTVRIGYIGGAISAFFAYVVLFLLNSLSFSRISEGKSNVKLGFHSAAFIILSVMIFFSRISLISRLLFFVVVVLLGLPEIKRCKRLLF